MGALSRIFLSFLLIPLTAAGAWAQCALPSTTDAFIDVSATTPIALGDDDAATFYWPVTFDLFSTNYNYVTIGSNGLITLQSAAPFPAPPPPNPAGSTDPNNVGMPNAAAPNAVVAPFWDDLDPSSGGNIYAAGHAAAGQPQRLVVQWDGVPHGVAGDALTFQAQLEQGTGEAVFCYQDVDVGNAAYDGGASATIGMEDDTGTVALQYSLNTASVANGDCIRFYVTCPCADADGDGFSVSGGVCGVVDCDDSNPAVSPGAPEIPGNGIDDNCDAIVCGSLPGDGGASGALAVFGLLFGALGAAAYPRKRPRE